MRITVSSDIKNAQSLNLLELGTQIVNGETSQTLFNLQAQNLTNQTLNTLKLKIIVKSNSRGDLLVLEQTGNGFSLYAQEKISTNSDNITDGIFTDQGREIKLDFDVDVDEVLTDGGKDIFENYATSLPIDVYTIEISVFSGELGRTVGRATEILGTEMKQKENNIVLQSPGDVLSSGAEITTTYPTIRWDGQAGINYRLIVVEDNGEGAESQLNSARSTEPALLPNNVAGNGSLLDYEMVDARIRSTEFQYPTSGVQALKPGSTYFWQVSATFESGSGTSEVFSEIWEFKVIDPSSGASSGANDQIAEQLKEIISPELVEALIGEGYSLVFVEIDGRSYTGVQMINALQQFKTRVENGEVTL